MRGPGGGGGGGDGMEIIQFAHRECDGRQLVSVF